MTTTTKKYEYRMPSGVILKLSKPMVPFDAERFNRERDEWYEKNKEILGDYSVEDFLREKREDVAKGLL